MSKSPIARLADHVEDRADSAVTEFRKSAEELGAESQRSLAKASRSLARASRALLKQAKKSGRQAGRFTGHEIRQHPVAAAAVLISAVALAGLALSRRH